MKMPLFCKRLNLPLLPTDMCDEIVEQVKMFVRTESENNNGSVKKFYILRLSDRITSWLKLHISQDMFFGIQIICYQDHHIHTDSDTSSKIVYVINSGGPKVKTRWFKSFQCVSSMVADTHQWYLFDVSEQHDIVGISEDDIRIGIFGVGSP